MKVIPIPCLNDNFAYLLICPETNEAAVVDPSEYEPVFKEVKNRKVTLTTIFNTHHHWDHVGGNDELSRHFPGIKIHAHVSDRDRVPGQTDFLEDGDFVQFGKQKGNIIHNPGHTSGAITYLFGNMAFTGDTLFSGGCGRVFEGTMEQMHHSLNVKMNENTGSDWQETLVDNHDTQDIKIENNDEYNFRKNLFYSAMKILNPREKEIIKLRRLSDKPTKLEDLSQRFKISRERVRQIEEKAFEKLQKEVAKSI